MTEITKKEASSVKKVSLAHLRSAFETGAIPTDSDYAALIARADIGRQAVGLSEDLNTVTENQTGLSWTANGPLTIKLAKGTNNESGLELTAKGVGVKPGAGIRVDDLGVAVRAVGALSADEQGLHLKLGPGLELADNEVTLNLKDGSGLVLEESGLAVKLAKMSGMSTEKGLSLIVDPKFLVQNENGLSLVAGVVKKAVEEIGGALQEAIRLVTSYTIEASDPTPENIDNSKVATRLQKTFSAALKSAKKEAPINSSLTGWAGSMRAELTLAHSSGQSAMVDSLVDDAEARNSIEDRNIYKADEGKGLFLAVRSINEMSKPRPTNATLIDAGGCIVAFKDSTAAVANKLYVGYGGYYLNLEEAFRNVTVNVTDIKFILMPGCKNSKSVLFRFTFPPA